MLVKYIKLMDTIDNVLAKVYEKTGRWGQFKYVSVTFPQQCLEKMRDLCLSDREFGGQFHPSKKTGSCKLDCDGVELIRGTILQDNNDDARHYQGDKKDVRVRIAVTPLYEEVFNVSPLCDSGLSINMFSHTHPLLLVEEARVGQLSPPSIGDFFAHGLLSNYRNWKENGVINVPILVSREGFYFYSILPSRFAQEVENIESMIRDEWDYLDEEQRKNTTIGELPLVIVENLKMRVFAELRPIHDQFQAEMQQWMRKHKSDLALHGAQLQHDEHWNTKWDDYAHGHSCCAFDNSIQADWFQDYCFNNYLMKHMPDVGFFYIYIPGPFIKDVVLACPNEFDIQRQIKNQ